MTGPWFPSDAADERLPRLLHAANEFGPRGCLAGPVQLQTEAPFVGREQLLEHIHELADVARSGQGVVVALSGETGIGKTRLLREIAKRGPAIGFLVDWIGDVRRFEDVLDGVDEWASPPDDHPEVQPPQMLHLRRSRRPRLVVIDDALLPNRLTDLAALARAGVVRRSMLILLGLSPDLSGNGASRETKQVLAMLARQRVLTKVPVPPLAEAELFEMARHLLGGRPDPRLQATVSSLCEGNPFLAKALLADLQERGQVGKDGAVCSLLGDLPVDYVPPSVATLLRHIFKSIGTDVLQSLASAATFGSGFQFAALEAVTGQPTEQLLEHMEAGLGFGIVREAAEPPDDFQFTHELVRRALHGGLTRVRRRRLRHANAGPYAGHEDVDTESHHGSAQRHGGNPSAEKAEALALTLRSLQYAERVCRWDEAIRHCRSALDLIRRSSTADPVGEVRLLDRLAALYFGRVQTFASGACLREAVQLCDLVDRPLQRVVLTARLAALGPSWCSIEAAEALFEQVVPSVSDIEGADRSALFDANLELGFAHQRYGRESTALHYFESAYEIVDANDRARQTLGQYALAATLISVGDIPRAVGLLREALASLDVGMAEHWSRDDDLIHWRDPRRTRCLALAELARALDLAGRTDEAERFVGAAQAEEIRFGILGGRAHRSGAQIELRREHPDGALQLFSALADEAAPGSLSMRRTADLVLVSAAHLALNNHSLALETASEGVSICLRTGAGESLAGLHLARARALLALGQLEAAREAISAAYAAINEVGTEFYRREADAVHAAIRAASDRQARDAGDEPRTDDDPLMPSAFGPTWTTGVAPTSTEAAARSRSDYVRGRSLTVREQEILGLMAGGKSNREIALQVGASDKTIKRHVSNIFNKLGANTRAMAVRRAHDAGLL
jgi:DNA-binding NarL/FixJ family response regulator